MNNTPMKRPKCPMTVSHYLGAFRRFMGAFPQVRSAATPPWRLAGVHDPVWSSGHGKPPTATAEIDPTRPEVAI